MAEVVVFKKFDLESDADAVLQLVSKGWEYRRVAESPASNGKPKATRVRRRRARCSPFTEDERLEMVKLSQSGLTHRVIAKRMRGSLSGVANAIRRTKKKLGAQ